MFTTRDISKALGMKEKEVLEHLPHVAKTVDSGPGRERFVVESPECMSCGFAFKKRDKLKTPGKCPICKSEEIAETRYGIEED